MRSGRHIVGAGVLLCLLISATSFGQQPKLEVSIWSSQFQPRTATVASGFVEPTGLSLVNRSTGQGLGATLFWADRFSAELMATRTRNNAVVLGFFNHPTFDKISIVPVTGVLQFHPLGNTTVDPYVGVGAGYVFFGQSRYTGTNFRNEPGTVVSTGLRVRVSPHLGLIVDGKYFSFRAVPTENDCPRAECPFASFGSQRASFRSISAGLAYRY